MEEVRKENHRQMPVLSVDREGMICKGHLSLNYGVESVW